MVDIRKIILGLIQGRKKYLEIDNFSDKPGIYALFFMGKDFPIDAYQPKEGEIIYIGKTESSQKSRDRDTHFATGKTRSSTVRRSFGALLRKELKLTPIVKSQADLNAGKIGHFMFSIDDGSEERLSQWMKENLGLSYFEYDKSPQEIESLESSLIRELVPVINLQGNTANPWKSHISALRKECGLIAYGENAEANKNKSEVKSFSPEAIKQNLKSAHKYEDIWKVVENNIFDAVGQSTDTTISLSERPFSQVGSRESSGYTFRIEYINATKTTKNKGSAVARDLHKVLTANKEFRNVFKAKCIVIRLDKNFDLHIINE